MAPGGMYRPERSEQAPPVAPGHALRPAGCGITVEAVPRRLRLRLKAALALAVMARAAYAAPVTVAGQIEAMRCCAEHCQQTRLPEQAGRCCGVDATSIEPTRVPDAQRLDVPAPALLAVLPVGPILAAVSMQAHRPATPHETATGPPLFLRLGSLIL